LAKFTGGNSRSQEQQIQVMTANCIVHGTLAEMCTAEYLLYYVSYNITVQLTSTTAVSKQRKI